MSTDGSRDDAPGDPSALDRARALLARAEAGLAAGDVDAAGAVLADMADLLAQSEDRSSLLGQALWVAALISLSRGRADEFARTSASAVDSLELLGEDAAAAELRRARDELLWRAGDELEVRQRGASGLIEVLARQAGRLLARARGELSWDSIDRDRDQLGALLALDTGDMPLARLLHALELDPVESALVAALVPLCTAPDLAAEARRLAGEPAGAPGFAARFLAELLFATPGGRSAVIDALAPRAPLVRYRVVRVVAAGSPQAQRVELEPAVLWFVRGTPLAHAPMPPGVSAHALTEPMDVAPPLQPVVDTLARAFAGPRSSLVVVAGRPGAGKLTATLAAAAGAGRPVIAVDADALAGAALQDALAVAARDAFLHGAVLLVRRHWDHAPGDDAGDVTDALRQVASEPGLRLCVATTPALGRAAVTAARRVRADVVLVDVPAIAEHEQHLAWQESLAALGLGPVDGAEIQAWLCRPGLMVGDIVDTIVEAVARSDASGQPLSVASLHACLGDRLRHELDSLAEVIDAAGPAEDDEAALARATSAERAAELAARARALADAVLAGQAECDELGVEVVQSRRPARVVARVIGGAVGARLAVARVLARRIGAPVARIDTRDLFLGPADRALARLRDAAAAAGRAGAVLVLERMDTLMNLPAGPVAGAVGALVDEQPATMLLATDRDDALPLAVTSRLADAPVVRLEPGKDREDT